MMKTTHKLITLLLTALLLCSLLLLPVTAADNPFVDVKEGKWYYDQVLWAYNHDPQITSGTDSTHFSPNATCTRAQVVTFLWHALGDPAPAGSSNPFTDVKAGKWYTEAILWAYHNNPQVAGGATTTTFGVNDPCKREQVVTFLWKAAGEPEPNTTTNPFNDVKQGKYYYKAVLWAVENGITSGMDATHFGVGKTCTRAQIVTFLYAAYALHIKTEPQDDWFNSATGSTVTLTVEAAGGVKPYEYDWRINKSGAWMPLTNGSGQTLTKKFTSAAEVKCYVTDATGAYVSTRVVSIKPYDPLTITQEPHNVSVEHKSDYARLRVVTSGGCPPLTYQWQYWYDWDNVWMDYLKGAAIDVPGYHCERFRCVVTDSKNNQVITKTVFVDLQMYFVGATAEVTNHTTWKDTAEYCFYFSGGTPGYTVSITRTDNGSSALMDDPDVENHMNEEDGYILLTAPSKEYVNGQWHEYGYICVLTDRVGQNVKSNTMYP